MLEIVRTLDSIFETMVPDLFGSYELFAKIFMLCSFAIYVAR